MELRCFHCGALLHKTSGEINRAAKIDAKLFCNRVCFGLNRRLKNPPPVAEKKQAKRLYDMKRRELYAEKIKEEKRAYFKAHYDPDKAREQRKLKMPQHVEYCRRPEYKKWKSEYDKKHLAKKKFGEFDEAYLLLKEIDKEIAERMSKYEIYLINGTLNKALMRRRAL